MKSQIPNNSVHSNVIHLVQPFDLRERLPSPQRVIEAAWLSAAHRRRVESARFSALNGSASESELLTALTRKMDLLTVK